MISSAWMERWPVWYDGGGRGSQSNCWQRESVLFCISGQIELICQTAGLCVVFCFWSTKWAQLLRRTAVQQPLFFPSSLLTCEGALQESPPLISPIRAAAVGLLELMRTGPLISMEWRCGGGANMGLWDMVREVKECRFLLFFFSPARWAPLLWGPEEAPSPESPLDSVDLSNSISWRAAELNYRRGRGSSKVEVTARRVRVVELQVLKQS